MNINFLTIAIVFVTVLVNLAFSILVKKPYIRANSTGSEAGRKMVSAIKLLPSQVEFLAICEDDNYDDCIVEKSHYINHYDQIDSELKTLIEEIITISEFEVTDAAYTIGSTHTLRKNSENVYEVQLENNAGYITMTKFTSNNVDKIRLYDARYEDVHGTYYRVREGDLANMQILVNVNETSANNKELYKYYIKYSFLNNKRVRQKRCVRNLRDVSGQYIDKYNMLINITVHEFPDLDDYDTEYEEFCYTRKNKLRFSITTNSKFHDTTKEFTSRCASNGACIYDNYNNKSQLPIQLLYDKSRKYAFCLDTSRKVLKFVHCNGRELLVLNRFSVSDALGRNSNMWLLLSRIIRDQQQESKIAISPAGINQAYIKLLKLTNNQSFSSISFWDRVKLEDYPRRIVNTTIYLSPNVYDKLGSNKDILSGEIVDMEDYSDYISNYLSDSLSDTTTAVDLEADIDNLLPRLLTDNYIIVINEVNILGNWFNNIPYKNRNRGKRQMVIPSCVHLQNSDGDHLLLPSSDGYSLYLYKPARDLVSHLGNIETQQLGDAISMLYYKRKLSDIGTYSIIIRLQNFSNSINLSSYLTDQDLNFESELGNVKIYQTVNVEFGNQELTDSNSEISAFDEEMAFDENYVMGVVRDDTLNLIAIVSVVNE